MAVKDNDTVRGVGVADTLTPVGHGKGANILQHFADASQCPRTQVFECQLDLQLDVSIIEAGADHFRHKELLKSLCLAGLPGVDY